MPAQQCQQSDCGSFSESDRRGDRFEAESAGLYPQTILPSAAAVMQEIGFDISDHPTRRVYDLHSSSFHYDYVITVCYEVSSYECPTFNCPCLHLNWPFSEPSKFKGNQEEILKQTRQVREQIHLRILQWIEEFNPEDLEGT